MNLPIIEGAQPVPWSPHGRILAERPVFTLHPLFHAGCYYVQDSSAMFVGHVFRKLLASLRPGARVLDLCPRREARPPTSRPPLSGELGDDFLLVSNEVMKDRVRVLDDNVARWGGS